MERAWKEQWKSNERAMKELGPKPYGKGFSPQKLKERSLVDLLSDQILYFISELWAATLATRGTNFEGYSLDLPCSGQQHRPERIHPDRRQLGRLDCWLDWLWCRRHPNEFQCLGKYRYELAFCLIVSLNFYKSCSRPAETETGLDSTPLACPCFMKWHANRS